MPRYDYRCTSCDKVFEVTHGMRERPEITCPDCGGPATRQLNMSGIVLKGSGFYNTDMRGKTGGTEGTGTAKASSDTGKADSSADSKPAAKETAASPATSN